ncbi:MAG: signal peptidase II [Clostridia bacterium]
MFFLYAGVVIFTVLLDQLSKFIVSSNMILGENIPLIKGFFEITYDQNKGAAFGILKDQPWIFISITIVVILILIVLLARNKFEKQLTKIACCLIIGGGIGNLIDRILNGFVVDFIDFKAIYFVCPAIFNLADTFVCVGTVLFAISFLFMEKKI